MIGRGFQEQYMAWHDAQLRFRNERESKGDVVSSIRLVILLRSSEIVMEQVASLVELSRS